MCKFEFNIFNEIYVDHSIFVHFILRFFDSIDEFAENFPLKTHLFFLELVKDFDYWLIMFSFYHESSQLLSLLKRTFSLIISYFGYISSTLCFHLINFVIISENSNIMVCQLLDFFNHGRFGLIKVQCV